MRYGEHHATAYIIVVNVHGKPAILERNWLTKIQLNWDLCLMSRHAKGLTPRRIFQGYLVQVLVLYKGMRQELH